MSDDGAAMISYSNRNGGEIAYHPLCRLPTPLRHDFIESERRQLCLQRLLQRWIVQLKEILSGKFKDRQEMNAHDIRVNCEHSPMSLHAPAIMRMDAEFAVTNFQQPAARPCFIAKEK